MREIIEFLKYGLWILDNAGGGWWWWNAGKCVSRFTKKEFWENLLYFLISGQKDPNLGNS